VDEERAPAGVDLALAALSLAGAAAILIAAAELPPPRWEPLGSAAVPRMLAGLMILFGGWIGIGAAKRLLAERRAARGRSPSPRSPLAGSEEAGGASGAGDAAAERRRALLRGAALLGAVGLFVLALDRFDAPFPWAATAFMVAAAAIVEQPTPRRLIAAALWGAALSWALFLAFTRFFYVNLG
jgi:putative tricarboxylic transport membrane protein